jgi:hypothetical protein
MFLSGNKAGLDRFWNHSLNYTHSLGEVLAVRLSCGIKISDDIRQEYPKSAGIKWLPSLKTHST